MNVCVITAYVVTLLSEMTFGIQMWQSLYVVAGTALNSVGFREQQFICALSVKKWDMILQILGSTYLVHKCLQSIFKQQ